MPRNYIASLPGGTASTSIQIQVGQTLKQVCLSLITAAAGSVEVSTSASSQIATSQPDVSVICRFRVPAAAGMINVVVPITEKVLAFQNIYVHQTGAANVGEISIS